MDGLALTTQIALFVGVLGLGLSLGTTIGLAELQSSCIAAGGLPEPGTPIPDDGMGVFPCWPGAQRLQWIANKSAYAAAALLLGGALLDRFDDRVREVIA